MYQRNPTCETSDELLAMLGTLRAQVLARRQRPQRSSDGVRFITISRQAGAGARRLAQRLADRLNARSPDGPRWTSWDRELMEKVARDDDLSTELIESLTEHSRALVDRLLADVGSAISEHLPDDFRIYRRVAQSIRALVEHGRVIIVGRGGMRVTRDMPGGLHIRLVAPRQHRIGAVAARFGIPKARAAAEVRSLDHGRDDFYRHFFPELALTPEHFSVTFNTTAVSEGQVLSAIIALIDNAILMQPP